ncbi:MAG: sulfur carrier protein ThiS [Candidatus Omnitrophota bacterium]|nr:sulfur carrier protein ThiS [Candidatus Omnitrophota bacterium]
MKLTVNGDPMDLPEGMTAAALLEQLKLNPGLVVVELNLNILKRDDLVKAALNEGDQVEIVHFVGGGCG